MSSDGSSCPNCTSVDERRFCPTCGQDKHRRIEAVHGFTQRILREATDLEGPLLRTLWLLHRRPGVLTREYRARRFRSQVAPVRLYLGAAAAWYFLFPVWSRWVPATAGGGAVSFVSPFALALAVPIWGVLVWVSLVGRGVYFEETFTFSAHFHVVYLSLFALSGCISALLGALGMSTVAAYMPLVVAIVLVPPVYHYRALRSAFEIGALRSALTAVILGGPHLVVLGAVDRWLA